MGGGDLNLKKSWHPSTLRNIERVWKAEQKHEVEQQKIEQLQKELAEERAREEIQTFAEDQGVVRKRDERLDWMYQGPAAMVNRDDYLLGRKIDKTLELLENQEGGEEKKEEYDVSATMFSSQDLSGTATVDLANKIREDPLFNIMKKEKEQRKNLLSNPVKMKQLQQLLQDSISNEKDKKSKKHKKHSDHSSEEKKHQKKHKKERHRRQSSADSDEHKKEKHRKQSSTTSAVEKRMTTERSNDHGFKRQKVEYNNKSESSSENKHYNSHYREREYVSKHDRSSDHYSSSSHKSFSRNSYQKTESGDQRKKKLDAEDRERLLQEMQENAKWREQQRERNTKRYREEEEKESKINKIDTSDFIKPMLSKAAEKGSLENRVKQKIFSIQRGSGVMDKHFARR